MNKTQIREEYEERLQEMYNQVEHYKERWETSEELYQMERDRSAKAYTWGYDAGQKELKQRYKNMRPYEAIKDIYDNNFSTK